MQFYQQIDDINFRCRVIVVVRAVHRFAPHQCLLVTARWWERQRVPFPRNVRSDLQRRSRVQCALARSISSWHNSIQVSIAPYTSSSSSWAFFMTTSRSAVKVWKHPLYLGWSSLTCSNCRAKSTMSSPCWSYISRKARSVFTLLGPSNDTVTVYPSVRGGQQRLSLLC